MARSNFAVVHRSDKEVTRQEIELARIDQQHREWRGEMNQPWNPVEPPPNQSPTLKPFDVPGYKIVVEQEIPRWRQVLRWWSRLLNAH